MNTRTTMQDLEVVLNLNGDLLDILGAGVLGDIGRGLDTAGQLILVVGKIFSCDELEKRGRRTRDFGKLCQMADGFVERFSNWLAA